MGAQTPHGHQPRFSGFHPQVFTAIFLVSLHVFVPLILLLTSIILGSSSLAGLLGNSSEIPGNPQPSPHPRAQHPTSALYLSKATPVTPSELLG